MAEQEIAERIQARAARAGLDVDDSTAAQAQTYMEVLRLWNQRMNLTRLGEDDEGLDRLVVEPLAAAARLPSPTATIMDIGSGGGSPAVPMKLARPEVAFRMVEVRKKKASFLREAVRRLALTDVRVDCCRYEELVAGDDAVGWADVVTVRAVRVDGPTLSVLGRLVRKGGRLFLFRGRDDDGLRETIRAPLHWEASQALVPGLASCLMTIRVDGT